MFKITDVEKLRDAYTLLAFIRDTTTAEQKSGMAAFIASPSTFATTTATPTGASRWTALPRERRTRTNETSC